MEEFITGIPYGALILAIVMSVSALLSALIPDDKMPGWFRVGLNFLAANFGNAKNGTPAAPDEGND